MWKKDDIRSELKGISPALEAISNDNVYRVPPFYFDHLTEVVLKKIKDADQTSLEGLTSKEMPFQVPPQYFEGLAGSILAKIKTSSLAGNEVQQELMEIAPTLVTISRVTPYTVPAGYFEQLQPVATNQTARVVKLTPVRKVLRYAAAAAVIGVTAISGFLLFDKSESNTTATEINVTAAMNNLSEAEIVDYLSDHAIAVDEVSIDYYLPETEENFDDIINDLSDEELQQFLKQNPGPTSDGKNGI